MHKYTLALVVVVGSLLSSALAVNAYVDGPSSTATGDQLALNRLGDGGESIDSLPPMYLSAFNVGWWTTPRGGKHYAVAKAGVVDAEGNPIDGALVEAYFDIPCAKGGFDTGSAYTELTGEGGELYAVATITGSKTFKCGFGCIVTGEAVSVTHPDYTWDPEGGVATTAASLCWDRWRE